MNSSRLSKLLLFYFAVYLILLKITPVTMGALTIALLFVLVIENLSSIFLKIPKLKRGWAVLLSSLLFYGILTYSIYSIVPIIIKEGQNVLQFIQGVVNKPAGELFPKIKNDEILGIIDQIMKWTGNTFADFAGQIGAFAISKIPSMLTGATLLVIASSYISAVLPKLKDKAPVLFPKCDELRVKNYLKELYGDMKKFVGGQMINAFIVGLIVWIGMSIFRINHSGFLGVLAGITDFIPFLGVIITAVPSIFIGLSQHGVWGIVAAVIVLTIANQIEGWVLAPKILGNRVKLNWFVVLISMMILSEIYGFIGVLISVPVLIIIRSFWRTFVAV